MKRLILLRHAKSSWQGPEREDIDRPLARRGERDAPRIGARLRECGARPDLLIASRAARALRTARLVAAELNVPAERQRTEPGLYLASSDEILDVIGEQDDELATLLIVGHNPGLTELVNRLLPEFALTNLPTAGVVVLDSTADTWKTIGASVNRLVYYDYPKNRGSAVTLI